MIEIDERLYYELLERYSSLVKKYEESATKSLDLAIKYSELMDKYIGIKFKTNKGEKNDI